MTIKDRSKEYYALHDSHKWLKQHSPLNISGRSTELSGVYGALADLTRRAFPINDVPVEIEDMLDQLGHVLGVGEGLIDQYIGLVNRAVVEQNPIEPRRYFSGNDLPTETP